MVPDIEDVIAAAERAMREVVLPALASDRQTAIDQAKIVTGLLGLLGEQAEHLYDYALAELAEFHDLARRLVGQQVPDPAASDERLAILAAAAEALGGPPRPYEHLRRLVRQVKDLADDLVASAEGEDVLPLVLDQSARQVVRERAWVRGTGFDASAADLPPLAALVGAARRPDEAIEKGARP